MTPDNQAHEKFQRIFRSTWDSYSFTAPEDTNKIRALFAEMYASGWEAAVEQAQRQTVIQVKGTVCDV